MAMNVNTHMDRISVRSSLNAHDVDCQTDKETWWCRVMCAYHRAHGGPARRPLLFTLVKAQELLIVGLY